MAQINTSVSRRDILFLIPTLTGGGAERVIVTLLRHLDRSRFKLALAVVDMREAVFRSDIPDDVEFIDLGCRRVRYALPKIVTLIWKRRPDVVFSTLGHLNLALAMLRPVLPRHPRYMARETIVVSQGIHRYRLPWLWKTGYRYFYSNHDPVVCQSHDMQEDLVENFAFPTDSVMVIHNPLDVERIRQLAAEPFDEGLGFEHGNDSKITQLVAAGRLVEQKGFDLLVEALALLKDKSVRVVILGDGPLRPSLEQLVQDRGVADRVRFAGFQTNPYAWFARADAFVLSSRFEGFPNVVLEALACGTAVIATPAPGGAREILEGIPGCVLAEAVSARALADAIDQWLDERPAPIPDEAVAPYRLSTIIGRYEKLLASS